MSSPYFARHVPQQCPPRGETPEDVVSQMEGAAFLDSDVDGDEGMVEAAKNVRRILQQVPMMRGGRRDSRIGRRAKATANEQHVCKLRCIAFCGKE